MVSSIAAVVAATATRAATRAAIVKCGVDAMATPTRILGDSNASP